MPKDLGYESDHCPVCGRITDHRCVANGEDFTKTCRDCGHTKTRHLRPEDVSVA